MSKIVTNHHWRSFVPFWELTPKQQNEVKEEYDHLDEIEMEDFILYKGNVYHFQDFMDLNNRFHSPNPPAWLKGWHGVHSMGFGFGRVIRLSNDGCKYQIGTYNG